MGNEQAILEVLERIRSRFYGKYRGVVTDVEQSGRGRIKATVPAVLGDTPTGWCDPCVPYAGSSVGIAFLPEVGSGVWIEFEGGDVSYPIWTGCYWSTGDIPSAASADVKTIITNAGTLAFDNSASSVTLQDSASDSLVFDSSGATITAGSGKIEVGASGVSVNSGALEVS